MELTRRQCSRLIKRYRELGPAGLVSRRRGKPGNHQLNATIRDQALQLIRSRGRGMNPSAIWRILTTEYGIQISKETVRKLMIAEKTLAASPVLKISIRLEKALPGLTTDVMSAWF
nr:helix-turn-helix domain-containing protein [Klebsiella pneumoniae subsp. pneumoniae]